MPLTPFHLGFAWPAWLMNRRKLHFMSLSFGAMIPDLEVVPMMLLTGEGAHARGLMHSVLGALTFDILAAMVFVFFVVPLIGRWVRRHTKENMHIFAGIDVTRPPSNIGWALLSAYIGTLSHIFIDMFSHLYNPIYWPYFTDRDINWLIIPGDTTMSSLVMMALLGSIAVVLAFRYWTRPYKSG